MPLPHDDDHKGQSGARRDRISGAANFVSSNNELAKFTRSGEVGWKAWVAIAFGACLFAALAVVVWVYSHSLLATLTLGGVGFIYVVGVLNFALLSQQQQRPGESTRPGNEV